MAEGVGAWRAYRAACPNCGGTVEFRSAASASAVCSFCRSTLVREGDALRRIGESAELFDDHSPLQLGASGVFQGEAFTLLGRLQLAYADGRWNEWHALFANGRAPRDRKEHRGDLEKMRTAARFMRAPELILPFRKCGHILFD